MNDDTNNKLEIKNTKPTSMRILVYDFIAQQQTAVSLKDIENYFVHSDRSTVYRTLKTFEEKGILHSIQENATTKYSLCSDECSEETHSDNHLHLYCKLCKQTTCEDNITTPQNFNSNFRIDEIRFFAKGICKNCLEDTLP